MIHRGVVADFARKLERERNEWEEAARKMLSELCAEILRRKQAEEKQ